MDRRLMAAVLSGSGPQRLFVYNGGADPTLSGGTFARTDASTCATYIDGSGIVRTVAANVPRFGHYDPSNVSLGPTLLLEGSRKNDNVYSRVLSNGAWTRSNMNVDPVAGADGVLASASRLTATAGNATAFQPILTHASQARAAAYRIRRITGTGNIDITLDGGTTWTTVTVTSSYVRQWKTQTLANSQFGVRVVTSGDVVDVDYTDNEAGTFPSSDIETLAAAVTRAADALSFPFAPTPQAMTLYVSGCDLGTYTTTASAYASVGSAASGESFQMLRDSGTAYRNQHSNGSAVVANASATPTFGQFVELRAVLNGDGSVISGASIAGGAETVAGPSAGLALGATFQASTLYVNSNNSTATGFLALRSLKIAAGGRDLGTVRGL